MDGWIVRTGNVTNSAYCDALVSEKRMRANQQPVFLTGAASDWRVIFPDGSSSQATACSAYADSVGTHFVLTIPETPFWNGPPVTAIFAKDGGLMLLDASL